MSLFPSQVILCIIVFFGSNTGTGCNDFTQSEPTPFVTTIGYSPAVILLSPMQPKSEDIIFAPTNIQDLYLETVTDSSEENACLTRNFLAVPVKFSRVPLSCGDYDAVMYRVRIINCGEGKLTLTALNFEFGIPKISNGEDAERRLFDGEKSLFTLLHDIRLCDVESIEWCRSAKVERIDDKNARISFSLRDEEKVQLDSHKEWGFDFKATRQCNRSETSLLRLEFQLRGVLASTEKGEDAFGGIFNPRQKLTISGWMHPRVSTDR